MLRALFAPTPSAPLVESPRRRAVNATLQRLSPHLPSMVGVGSVAPFLSLALSKCSDADLDAMIEAAHAELSALVALPRA